MSIDAVLQQYSHSLQPDSVESLGGAGGFSGARFWRVAANEQVYCLRRWPREHPTLDGLLFIHRVLQHVTAEGFGLVPVPLFTCRGTTYVEHGQTLWEMTPWLRGIAHTQRPADPQSVARAMTALAQFHLAVATFSPQASPVACGAFSPGLATRCARVEALSPARLRTLAGRIDHVLWPEGAGVAEVVLDLIPAAVQRVIARLRAAAEKPVIQLPCIRDIRGDHVLFHPHQPGEVIGLIDFGALCWESPAGDVARLLGSYAADDEAIWRVGLEAYHRVRPLSAEERNLVQVFDQSSVLLSGLNWIEWIFEQHRQFERMDQVAARLEGISARLTRLAGQRDKN